MQQYAGYGWLRPEGVRKQLEEMTANWTDPMTTAAAIDRRSVRPYEFQNKQ